jgi:hypothetical protein
MLHQLRGELDEAAAAFEGSYRSFAAVRHVYRLWALRSLLGALSAGAANGPEPRARLERWLDVLIRETRVARSEGEDRRQIVESLGAIQHHLERYREVVGAQGWDQAPKVFHDMQTLLNQLKPESGALEE